jgi:hypothetical protein
MTSTKYGITLKDIVGASPSSSSPIDCS